MYIHAALTFIVEPVVDLSFHHDHANRVENLYHCERVRLEERKGHATNRICHGTQEEEEHGEEYPGMTCDIVPHGMGSDGPGIGCPEDCGRG